MTLYGSILFIHVVAAIVLVGGSVWAHVVVSLSRRATSVEGLRSNLRYLHVFVRASGPIAAVTGLAGLYLTFAGQLWGAGWPVVSLTLFVLAGAAAGGVLDPAVGALKEAAETAPDGPVPAELRVALGARRLTMVSWMMAGADLAIVFLMTNKPGYAASVAVAAVGLALGAGMGLYETRHAAEEQPAPAVV